MSYDTANPPRLMFQGVGAGPKVYLYVSTDATATVDASGYFTDGYKLGMRDDDQCIVVDTTNSITTWHYVIVSGTTVDLSNGTTIGTATNSD